MTLSMWKNTLAKGKTIDLQVQTEVLQPTLRRGDAVTVRQVPFHELTRSDIVLCVVGGKVGLRKIAQARQVYGVKCLEVLEGKTTHYIQEGTTLGKVVHMRRQNEKVATPSPIASVTRAIKRVLFPGL